MHRTITTKPRFNHLSSILCAGLCAGALLAASGCVGDPYEVCPEDQRVRISEAQANIWPPVVHTGYNGRDTFLAPISTNYVVDEWTTDDVRVANVSGYPICGTPSISDPSGLVIAENVGMTRISAHATDIDGALFELTVDIMVEQYTEEEVDLGELRYRTGEGTGDRRPCASCHEAANGVDHTPLEMAYHDDEAILLATTDGRYPDFCTTMAGEECTCGAEGCDGPESPGYVLRGEHSWELTDPERRAIVAFMRSLRPRGI